MVTDAPRSAKHDANSQPIAPPPITAIRDGILSSASTSSEVMIGPPTAKPGIVRGTEPAARITFAPTSCLLLPSLDFTVTVRPAPSEPVPSRYVTFLLFVRPVKPFTRPLTMVCLRAWVTAKFTLGADASTPKSLAWAT